MKKVLKVLAGIGVVVVIIIAGVLLTTTGVADKAESIMTQFHNGDIEAIYNDSAMTDSFTLEEFEEAMGIGSDYSMAEAEKVSWLGKGFENGEKYIYGDFKFSTGETQTLTFWFIESEGELKLLGITSGMPE